MRVTVLQENLRTAIHHSLKAVSSKPPLAILNSVLLQAFPGYLQISATDLYVGIRSKVLGTITTEGSIVIPAKLLSESIATLPPGQLELEVKDTSLLITSGKDTLTIQGQAATEYPDFPEVKGESYSLSLSDLEQIETYVRFAAGTDATRVVLTALLFLFSPEGVKIVGTDGFRLAYLNLPTQVFTTSYQMLVPAKAISELLKIAVQEKVEKIDFVLSEELKQLSFKIGEAEMYVRMVEGQYPPYEKIMPEQFEVEASWDGEEFLSQLKRATVFARDVSNIIRLKLENDVLTLNARTTAQGEYVGTMPIKLHKGSAGSIAFNIRYLMDFMTYAKPKQVWFGMNESLKPAILRPDNKELYSYVVMPFRVTD